MQLPPFRCQLPVEMVDVEVKVKKMPKAPSLPLPHPKDENLFRFRKEAWS